MKVTDTWLQTAIARNRGRSRYRVTADRGAGRRGSLMVTIYGDGSATFSMRYTRPSGKRVFMPLGRYGPAGISLKEACNQHDEALRQLEQGHDPIDERAKRQAELLGGGTVGSLVEQFVHRKLRAERWDGAAWVRDRASLKARKRPDEAARWLLGYGGTGRRRGRKPVRKFFDEFGGMKAREVTRRQLIEFLEGIVARGAPVTANRTYALLRQLFAWGAAKDLIPASPMAGVERPGGQEQPRSRILTDEEVRTFWHGLEGMAAPTRLALQVLLATAQRRGELTRARWTHFDLAAKVWTIPPELQKTSHSRREQPQPHTVPLSPLALELLEQLHRLTGGGEWVLPAPGGERPYSENALSRALHRARIGTYTVHDLRRTAASLMTRLGIPRLHVEKVLGHETGDIAAIYDRHDYAAEKRTALERWAEYLGALVEGRAAVVVPMERGLAEPSSSRVA